MRTPWHLEMGTLLWIVAALVGLELLVGYRDRRRHRRNRAGQCAFCRARLLTFDYRVEGAWVCDRCARRTTRSAYAALILLGALAVLSVALGVVDLLSHWRVGTWPDLWSIALVLLVPAVILGLWWYVVKAMQSDNRTPEQREAAEAMLAAVLDQHEAER
jgi:hypothetical protein